ncbi:hypothetical protein [Pseudomonas schmalbachii]|uniref:Uncharacterized protein n=1 Tax=Pseudomonas schmalbachii TaxID=2816993 RepID=A0ABS3TKH6_9PSED|nr:hypothetical protein [Pseudomonas schmalbachii]MBO3274166.1 hypothetical protein [Pseudomonas schmalbachii]
MSQDHPFYSGTFHGHHFYCMTADDRIQRVASFDLDTCHRALALGGLQKSVRQAIERRMRQLERASQ